MKYKSIRIFLSSPCAISQRIRFILAISAIVIAMASVPFIQWLTGGEFLSKFDGNNIGGKLLTAIVLFPMIFWLFFGKHLGVGAYFIAWVIYFFLAFKIATVKTNKTFMLLFIFFLLCLCLNVKGCVNSFKPIIASF